MFRHRSLALALQLFLRAEAEVGLTFLHQALGVLTINVEAIALAIGRERTADIGTLVPVDAEPLEVCEKLIFVASFTALEVGVFDAQDHRALHLAGEKPVIECSAGVADVQLPGRRWRETDAYLRILAHTL